MDTKSQSRIENLAFLLNQMNELHLRDAAKILNVSEMTIRRDLNSHTDTLALLGGYIVKKTTNNRNDSYQILEQETKNLAEKMHIGRLAANLVKEGDIIFFDCGSTIPFIISQINPEIKFTALCCSINSFLLLQDKPNCTSILCGGSYSKYNSFFTPLQTRNELDLICTTKAFISAAGIDSKQGVTCFNLNEAKVKQKAMTKTAQSILVCEHSKFDQVQQAYIADLNEFDRLVLDQPLPEYFACIAEVIYS